MLALQKQCSNLSLTDASVAVVVVSGNTNTCAIPTMHFALYTQSEYIPTMHFVLYTHQSQYTPTMQQALPRTLMDVSSGHLRYQVGPRTILIILRGVIFFNNLSPPTPFHSFLVQIHSYNTHHP